MHTPRRTPRSWGDEADAETLRDTANIYLTRKPVSASRSAVLSTRLHQQSANEEWVKRQLA